MLASVLLIVLLTGAALSAMTATSVNQNKMQNLLNEKQAFYLAEAGLVHGKVVLNQNIANWNTYATVSPQTLVATTSLSGGGGSYKVTIKAASGPGLLMTATGTSNTVSTSVSSLVIIGYSNFGNAFITGQDLTISGNPTIDGTAGGVFANRNLTISGSPYITVHAEAVGTYTVVAPGSPVVNGFAGGGQPSLSINNISPSTYYGTSAIDYYLNANGTVSDTNSKRLSASGTWNCWTPTPATTTRVGSNKPYTYITTPATWTLTCSTPVNGTFYVDGNTVISTSAGTAATPWIATILSNYSIHVTTGASTLYMRPPAQTDGSLYKSLTVNKLFIAAQDILIDGTATQTFSSAIIGAYEQVSISGNPTITGYIIAQDSANSSSLVTSNSISGNMHLTYNGDLANGLAGTAQVQSTLY